MLKRDGFIVEDEDEDGDRRNLRAGFCEKFNELEETLVEEEEIQEQGLLERCDDVLISWYGVVLMSHCVVQRLIVSTDSIEGKRWFQLDTASRGPTTIVAPESQFRTCPSDHDNIGYPRMSASGESSTTMHRLLHASGSHPIPPPNDPKTNQYNQDLGLIHSTNGNHLESPNEGSSIDHQVTIYLHAHNITMFPTNETWYFASQILVSSLGGLILILTAQSTRN
ncbi:hypothetical protein F511_29361 [Dorcoceras hygrometricum]|uniref:Uncharacterized protein n=1 Tax=Dorcoceras hygrometricum TaxID=472368 RepID=A0A2Z7DAV7_9LAMI|nr:hypothetical protein F511_29361 [Dorcoceras hygrometricum]